MAPHQMSQAEIWDDSALVNSWNDALEEYKKYHSIAAKGQNVEEVLKIFGESDGENLGIQPDEMAEDTNVEPIGSAQAQRPTWDESKMNGIESEHTRAPQRPIPNFPTSMPQSVLGTQDESMKNLMMSWYYAGYYTGLAEGQQKAYAEMEEQYAEQQNDEAG